MNGRKTKKLRAFFNANSNEKGSARKYQWRMLKKYYKHSRMSHL